MRKLFFVLFIFTILSACSINDPTNNNADNTASNDNEKEKFDVSVEINEELEFEQFDIEFEKAKAYEKDGKYLIDLHFSWRNKKLDDGSSLYVATLMDVNQNKNELSDLNDHWNPEGDKGLDNDVFLPNTSGGLSPVKLTYELDNNEDDVIVSFYPTTETEEQKEVTIEIN